MSMETVQEYSVNVIDESYEDTSLYSWSDGTMKQVPYEEYTAKTGQKVKKFLGFVENLKVIIVNVNTSQMILTVWNGILKNGSLVKGPNPVRFRASNETVTEGNIIKHKVSAENPLILFSLNKDSFGKAITPHARMDDLATDVMW